MSRDVILDKVCIPKAVHFFYSWVETQVQAPLWSGWPQLGVRVLWLTCHLVQEYTGRSSKFLLILWCVFMQMISNFPSRHAQYTDTAGVASVSFPFFARQFSLMIKYTYTDWGKGCFICFVLFFSNHTSDTKQYTFCCPTNRAFNCQKTLNQIIRMGKFPTCRYHAHQHGAQMSRILWGHGRLWITLT